MRPEVSLTVLKTFIKGGTVLINRKVFQRFQESVKSLADELGLIVSVTYALVVVW